MKRLFLCMMLLSLMVLFPFSVSLAVEPAPRITDREIIEGLVELKAGQKALEQRIGDLDKRVDSLERSLNQRIDGLQNLIYVLISAIFAQTIGIVGFVLWDRKTTLTPVVKRTDALDAEIDELRRKTRNLEEKTARLEGILKGYAPHEPHTAHG